MSPERRVETRLASVSVDLDSLHHYARIHGLSEEVLPASAREAAYALGLRRFLALFKECSVAATLFVIGEDAQTPWARSVLEDALAEGHELGNHSLHHAYDLSRLEPSVQAEEVGGAGRALEALGTRPVGFRAPGYTLSSSLYATLRAQGYAYDSSVFPAAPYYFAKAGVLAALRLAGRPSRSILDRPRVLLAPRRPYWPDPEEPYRRGSRADGVFELPITVAKRTQVPFIGTLVTSFPWPVVQRLYGGLSSERFFNLELHAVDLLDADDGLPAELVRRQRDLRRPWSAKRARLAEVFGWLRRDYRVVPLADAAAQLR